MMMKGRRVAVLGAGSVGSVVAADLAEESDLEVVAFDRDEAARGRLPAAGRVRFERADLSDPAEVARAVEHADLVIGTVPGFLGFRALRVAIEAKRDVVDVSFMPEDPFELEARARENGVTAIVDCGVAPGLSNLIVGRAAAELDPLHSVRILVGGLPVVRRWPYEYCAVFSPLDVLEEYTRPARLVEGGRVVVREPLTEVEPVEIPGVGTLEAFNSDGLRTLLRTVKAQQMAEKTMRYPGHADRMRMLRETGFFSAEPMDVGGVRVRPIDLTAKLLFPKWRLPEGEGDVTAMRIEIEGDRAGRRERRSWTLVDRRDAASGRTSMARTTGFPAAIAARMVLHGLIRDRGILPTEVVGRDERVYRGFLDGLAKRGVVLHEETVVVPPTTS